MIGSLFASFKREPGGFWCCSSIHTAAGCFLSPQKPSPKGGMLRNHIFVANPMDLTWLSALLLGAGCLAFGYYFGSRRHPPPLDASKHTQHPLHIDSLAHILLDFKMVLVVRNDLKMGKGKIAAQCSHATLGLYKKLHNRAPKALNRWEMCGQVKVVVKTESEEEMLALQGKAKSAHLPTHITVDAGRTQIAPNSRTVMAILGPADMVDGVTGGLKLL